MRTENPRVGGSIPSLATVLSSGKIKSYEVAKAALTERLFVFRPKNARKLAFAVISSTQYCL